MVSVVRGMIAHVITVLSADAFVFFGLTTLQGLLIVIASRRGAERAAPIIQTGVVIALLLTLMFLMPVRDATRVALEQADPASPILRWFPLAWFIGLSETIRGTTRPVMSTLAIRGVLAGVVPLLATAAIYTFAYRRLCARAIETPSRASGWSISRRTAILIKTLLVRRPIEQAVCAFTLRVLARSRRHRMLLSIYVGAALALISTALLPDVLRGQPQRFTDLNVAVLAAPLILSAALGVGFRALLAIPVDMPARWIFQTFSVSPLRIGGGVHKAGLLVVLVPVVLTAALSAALLWGPAIAWRHALFCGVLSIFLLELLLVSYSGLPFSRVYVPGGSRFHVLWPLYISCFITYTYSAASAERELLTTHGLRAPIVTIAVLAMALAIGRLWRLWRMPSLSFEVDLPDQAFAGFNLSEGLAAQAVASHNAGPSTTSPA
jgi:hypothetical protein